MHTRIWGLAVFVFVFPGAAVAASTGFERPILEAHNAERRAVAVPDLVWSDRLAADAAVWAQHLAVLGRLQHASRGENPDEGENLWMGTAGAYAVQDMVAGWAGEKSGFHNGVFPDVAANGSWSDVGHYTQMIWKTTTAVGCATASSAQWDVLVCRYGPTGNVMGERPF
jgi:uncharacterized protein YkwD